MTEPGVAIDGDAASVTSRPGGDGPAAETSRRGHVAVFAVTALGAFMASLDLSIVNIAFPALERSFPHDPRASLVWVITGYSIVFGSLLVTAGRTADRLGRRRVFLAGLCVFCLGSALCGVAPSVDLLVAGRVVQGAGAAALLPSSLGLLLGAFPAERRAQIVALWGGVGALAVATGPSLGAGLISAGGWRLVFFVNLPVGALAALLGWRVLSRTPALASAGTPDYPGVVLVEHRAWRRSCSGSRRARVGAGRAAASIGCFVATAVLGVVFVVRSSRHEQPVLDLQLFSSRSFTVANAAMLVYAMGFFAMLLGNILFLTSVWHYSILRAGLAVTPGPLVVASVAGPAGRLAARIGFRPVLLAGAGCFAGGLAWYAIRTGLQPSYLAVWLPATLVTGLGIGLTFPVLGAAAVSSLPPDRFGVGSAVNQTAAPGRRRRRRGLAGGHPRIPAHAGGCVERLSAPLGLRGLDGAALRLDLPAPRPQGGARQPGPAGLTSPTHLLPTCAGSTADLSRLWSKRPLEAGCTILRQGSRWTRTVTAR